jgi:hypothetical protein
MAFNPFHSFRKHQKVIFAVMAIVCMFVFVLQFGKGDFFERAASLFGAGKGQGPLVATVYGTKVYRKQLLEDRKRADVANELVKRLQLSIINSAANAKGDKDGFEITRLATAVKNRTNPFGEQSLPAFLDLVRVQSLREQLKDKPGKEQQRKALDDLEAALKIQEREFPGQFKFNYNYTAALMNPRLNVFGQRDTLEQQLDFLIWKHQADQLGIVLNESDVRKLLQHDTGGRDLLPEGAFKTDKDFQDRTGTFATEFRDFTEKQILEALADEYRVLLAQEALLGEVLNAPLWRADMVRRDPVDPATKPAVTDPVTVTPGEFLHFLREQRTTVKAALLPISVDRFEDQVKDKPSEDVLLDLYKRYKSFEPRPQQALPGFKQPRTVRVAYTTVSYNDDLYRQAAKKAVPETPGPQMNPAVAAAQSVLSPTGGFPLGSVPVALAAGPLDPVWWEYAKYSEEMKDGELKGHNVNPGVYQPEYDTASALGHVLSGLAQGNPAAAPTALTATDQVRNQAKARAAGAALLAGTSGTPAGLASLQAATIWAKPLDQVQPYIVERARKEYAKALLKSRIETFEKELAKLQKEPAKAKEYVEKAAEEYGFKVHTMAAAKDQHALAEDEALKELREALTKRRFAPVPLTKPENFGADLTTVKGLYTPDSAETSDDRHYIFWLVEDNPPVERSFAKARADVEKAWRHMKARTLARNEAKRLEAAAKAKSGNWPTDAATRQQEVLAWLNEQPEGSQAFTLGPVSRLVEQETPNAGLEKLYRLYTPPEDKIKYPPRKFADTLLGLGKPGDATYLEDQPENTLYVAVLLTRTPPTAAEFEDALKQTRKDQLWRLAVATQRKEFYDKFMERLREEASKDNTENGQWKLPEELRQRAPTTAGTED